MNRKKKLNKLGLNDCFMDKKNPFELFKVWMSKAEKTEINDPNALALATVNSKKTAFSPNGSFKRPYK